MTKLTNLRPQKRNANLHTQRGIGMLENSIQRDGWIGAITVAADGETFDGSARLEVGASAGFEDAIVVRSDGSKPIVHIREDIPNADDPRAKRLGIAANRVASVDLQWDTDVLADLNTEGVLDTLFYENEIDALLGNLEGVDASELWRGMPEFEQDNLEGYLVHVHCVTEADREKFLKQLGLAYTTKGHSASVWYPEKPEAVTNQAPPNLRYASES